MSYESEQGIQWDLPPLPHTDPEGFRGLRPGRQGAGVGAPPPSRAGPPPVLPVQPVDP